MGIESVSPTAPIRPPAIDDMKAIDKAFEPSPCLAISWPSSSRTAAADEPGTPIRIDAMASEWCTTATAPMISAIAGAGSRTKTNGSMIATAAVPPSPGMTPMTSPATTPSIKNISRVGSAKELKAARAASMRAPRQSVTWLGGRDGSVGLGPTDRDYFVSISTSYFSARRSIVY
jgi:hypothetical protein